jgi:ribosomal protein S18 acetylase RimI-like enzyme
VRAIVESAGFFTPAEVDVAVELVEERLAKGPASGYHFLFLDGPAGPVGYACFGPIPCTVSSFDVYWIAVHAHARGGGLGKALMAAAERAIGAMGGTRIYVETSSRPLYGPTRAFYEKCGYRQVALLPDFYAPGDGKLILSKPAPVV